MPFRFLSARNGRTRLLFRRTPAGSRSSSSEGQVPFIGSFCAFRIRLLYGLEFSRAVTTSAILVVHPTTSPQVSSPSVARRAIGDSPETHAQIVDSIRPAIGVFIWFGGPQGHLRLPQSPPDPSKPRPNWLRSRKKFW